MAVYEGTTVRIKATIDDFDNQPINDATSATVDLYDSAGNYVFTSEALTYDVIEGYWYFDWQDSLAGSWTAKCTFSGIGFVAYDYGSVRVKAKKITPTGQAH